MLVYKLLPLKRSLMNCSLSCYFENSQSDVIHKILNFEVFLISAFVLDFL